ncbi:MAG: hypothetical protein QMC83_00950 [Thermodesulfovibrionales bacterium]|nr:hypothetical protein [Thermodesulfovibrionales bacterium]
MQKYLLIILFSYLFVQGIEYYLEIINLKHMKKHGTKVPAVRLQILEHENKIKKERAKPYPDEGRIHHWEAEIEAFHVSLKRALKRLGK